MFSNLKISTRLSAAFGLMVILLLGLGVLSVFKTLMVETDLVDFTDRRMTIIAEMEILRDEGNFQAGVIRNIALLTDPAKVSQEKQAYTESRSKVNKMTIKLEAQIKSPEGRELFTRVQENRKPWREAVDKIIALIDVGDREQAVSHLCWQCWTR